MTIGKFNFTGRRLIKVKAVTLSITKRCEGFIRVKIILLDLNKFKKDYPKSKLVLDGHDRGNLERVTLDFDTEQVRDFNGFGQNSKPKFRIKLVSTAKESEGKVLASTKEISPKETRSQIQKDQFFKPDPEDIGDIPWFIDWEGDDPRLVINIKLYNHFRDWKNPVLQALYLPNVIKELLIGIITRNKDKADLENDSMAFKMFTFCDDRLRTFPDGPFWEDDGVNTEWLNWADRVVEEFCGVKWRQDQTLLEQMLGGGK